MCGIAGAITTRTDQDFTALIDDITRAQTARGPDARVVRTLCGAQAKVVFGHNRLSIIDLSEAANQPMTDQAGRLTIVFNGEIYNYRELRAELELRGAVFATASDTEVLLEAYRCWGEKAFERLYGMFALAIHDKFTGRVVLARDRFGVKPLYIWDNGRTLVFASTPGRIAAWAGLKPDLAYVERGLRLKYYEDDGERTPYAGLGSVPAGCWLAVNPSASGLRRESGRYYDLGAAVARERAAQVGLDEAALEARILSRLSDACDIRMRADVPVGLSLSGGVDSSSVAVLTAPLHPDLVGYSFGHPDCAESEAPLVETLAGWTPVRPRYVWPTKPAQITDLFWQTLAAQDAPFPHASMMAQHAVFRAARADGVKVLLGGQGGDEAFMGYRKFYLFYAQATLRGRNLGDALHLGMALPAFAGAVAGRANLFWQERGRYAGKGLGARLALEAEDEGNMGMAAGQTPAERQRLDVTRYSLPSLLRYEDRNSLGTSVESRLPFMDHRVIETGLALPERLKLAKGFGKWILRSAMRSRIPDTIRLNRDKRGFDVNQDRWIDQGLGQVIRGALHERKAAISAWMPAGSSIDEMFSDTALKSVRTGFAEAVSLIWLGDRS